MQVITIGHFLDEKSFAEILLENKAGYNAEHPRKQREKKPPEKKTKDFF